MNERMDLSPDEIVRFESPQQSEGLAGKTIEISLQDQEIDTDHNVHTANVKEAGVENLFVVQPAQAEYLQTLIELLAPYDTAKVQELDEQRRPPVELLNAVTERRAFVNAVPIPEPEIARELLRDETLNKQFTEDQRRDLALLVSSPAFETEMAAVMKGLDTEGRATSMVQCSMAIPKYSSVGIGTFLGVNNGLAAQSIARIGTPEQQALWLHALNQGVLTYGFGLTEDKVGSDPRSIKTTFRKETDEAGNTVYVLNGDKRYIGNAARVEAKDGTLIHRGADFLVVYAVDDPDKSPKDRSYRAFMVPRDAIGEENIRHTGNDHNKMGLREVNNGDFDLRDVVVPESCLLGNPDENVYPKLMALLDVTRLFVGGMGNGAAEAALATAREYAAERNQNGRAIEDYQMVAFPLLQLEAEALAGKLLNLEAARLVDQATTELHDNDAIIEHSLECFRESEQRLTDTAGLAVQGKISAAFTSLRETAESMIESGKLRKQVARIKEISAEIFVETRKLRDTFKQQGNLQAFEEVKNAYKALKQAVESLTALQEPVHFGTETAMSKLFNTELAERAALQAINTLGGNGYMEDPEQGRGLPKRLRDAKVLTIYEGTSNIQRNIIAQGIILKEIKAMRSSFTEGLKYFLLKTEATKRTCYSILKNRSNKPLTRARAAYSFAVVSVMNAYNDSLANITREWDEAGVPPQYASWDEGSIERQKNLEASLSVQARMGILADVATAYTLMELADRHLSYLGRKASLSQQEQRDKTLLELFQSLSLDSIIENGRKLGSDSLELLENLTEGDSV